MTIKSGWLNINKELNITSNNVVGKIKYIIKKTKKIGHAGTLDPLASGVLPIAIGEATKTVEYIMHDRKRYLFHLTFGELRDTFDAEGVVLESDNFIPKDTDIKEVLNSFIGRIKQTPPAYSAIKINGKRAYDLARSGEDVKMVAREIEIFSINYNGFVNKNTVELIAECGKGTYIRSLAVDIARKVGSLGYVSKLERQLVGDFKIENSVKTDDLTYENINDFIIPINDVLNFDLLTLNGELIRALKDGKAITSPKNFPEEEIIKILDEENNCVSLCKYKENMIKSIKFFH